MRRSSTAGWAACVVGLGLGLAGCTQPTFPGLDAGAERSDAAQPFDADQREPAADAVVTGEALDAGVIDGGEDDVDTGVVPANIASTLLGSYARRTTFFDVNTSNNDVARGIELAAVDFTLDEHGGVVMRTALCDVAVDNSANFALVVTHPDALGEMTQPVLFNADGSFHVARSSIFHGYDPDRADTLECAGAGDRKPRGDDQTWPCTTDYPDYDDWNTRHTCACPGINAAPPNTPTDCRLVDAEGDGAPGITGAALVLGAEVPFSMTLEVSIGYERVTIGPERQLQGREARGLNVSCLEQGGVCNPAPTTACRPETSQVVFLPLTEPTTCAELLAQRDQLFVQTAPSFPSLDTCFGR